MVDSSSLSIPKAKLSNFPGAEKQNGRHDYQLKSFLANCITISPLKKAILVSNTTLS